MAKGGGSKGGSRGNAKPEARVALDKNDIKVIEIKERGRIARADMAFKTVRSLGFAAMIVLVSYCVYLSVGTLAGKNTTFVGIVDAMMSMSIDRWLAWTLASVFGGGWYFQRKLHRKTIKQLGTEKSELEKRLHAKRESSGLLTDGQPSRKDRDA